MTPLSMGQLDKLWQSYKEKGDQNARNALIKNFCHLVPITAGRVITSVPAGLEREDLVSAGTIGLIKAVDQFDPKRNVKFETYAIALIRGAILEMVRTEDWVPRSIRDKMKAFDRTVLELELNLGRPPTDDEIAEALDMTVDALHQLMVQANRSGLLSFEELLGNLDFDEHTKFIDIIEDENSAPDAESEGREVRKQLMKVVDKLPDRERLVIALYYYEGLTFREIGEILGVSESRIYQIHSGALMRMKTYLEAEGGIFAQS